MIIPEDIIFNDNLTPSEASEYILSLEHYYIQTGKRLCDEMVYTAALKAINVIKSSKVDIHVDEAANSFLLNAVLETRNKVDLKEEYIKGLLEERDWLIEKYPQAIRSVIYHLSIPFQSRECPKGVEIGLFTTFEKAERALEDLVKNPFHIFNPNAGMQAQYVIAQEVIDCYNIQPKEAFISVSKYNFKGELVAEWYNRLYNSNRTLKCDWEMEYYGNNLHGTSEYE